MNSYVFPSYLKEELFIMGFGGSCGGCGFAGGFALLVVLFILLIIVGAACFC
ncbi:Sporulation protein YjcZ [Bacillus sp. IT-79MI2]|nr:hypothetical protein BTH41_03903 [Bacillus mycoides]